MMRQDLSTLNHLTLTWMCFHKTLLYVTITASLSVTESTVNPAILLLFITLDTFQNNFYLN